MPETPNDLYKTTINIESVNTRHSVISRASFRCGLAYVYANFPTVQKAKRSVAKFQLIKKSMYSLVITVIIWRSRARLPPVPCMLNSYFRYAPGARVPHFSYSNSYLHEVVFISLSPTKIIVRKNVFIELQAQLACGSQSFFLFVDQSFRFFVWAISLLLSRIAIPMLLLLSVFAFLFCLNFDYCQQTLQLREQIAKFLSHSIHKPIYTVIF